MGNNLWSYLPPLTPVLNANIVFVPKCQFVRAFKLTLASPREWQVGEGGAWVSGLALFQLLSMHPPSSGPAWHNTIHRPKGRWPPRYNRLQPRELQKHVPTKHGPTHKTQHRRFIAFWAVAQTISGNEILHEKVQHVSTLSRCQLNEDKTSPRSVFPLRICGSYHISF